MTAAVASACYRFGRFAFRLWNRLKAVAAFALDAVKRINAWQPLNPADCVADLLYLPDARYCIGLAAVMLGGPGPLSLDAVIATRLST